MSCGNPVAESDALMQKRNKYDKTKNCVKCKAAQGNIVIRHAVYCKACFVPLVTHKFRRTLEPTVNPKPDGPRRTALKPAGNLMIGFSGGLGSSILLDLVHRCYVAFDKSTMPADGGRDHPRHERAWKKITVCYVEVCEAFPGMRDRTDEIARFVARYNELDFVALRIRDAFDLSWWHKISGSSIPSVLGASLSDEALFLESLAQPYLDSLTALRTYLSAIPTTTAVHSSVHTLIRLLLLHTALQTGSSHLVLGTSLTSLAVSLISGVAQGAGFHVREETQEEWSPGPEIPPSESTSGPSQPDDDDSQRSKNNLNAKPRRTVRVVRPLRDIGTKECAAWAWWSGIPIVGKEKWFWSGAKPGIGTLTKEFIVGLEQDYPSTVSTIVRTCSKLAPKGAVAGRCILCARPTQAGVQEWKARISIRSLPSSPAFSAAGAPSDDPHSHSTADHTLHANSPRPSLTPYLCYPCHTTLISRSARPIPALWPSADRLSPVALPSWTEAQLPSTASSGDDSALADEKDIVQTRKMGRDEMKDIVNDFLLDN